MLESIGNKEVDKTAELMTKTLEKKIETQTNFIKINARLQALKQNLRMTLFAAGFVEEDENSQGSFGELLYKQIRPLGRNMDLYL